MDPQGVHGPQVKNPCSRVLNDKPRDIYIIGERANRARRYFVMCMETRDIIIGERSEPLSRVFNDQPSGIYGGIRTYVRF